MRHGPHHHPCTTCRAPVECAGDLERNYDGWPEVICRAYHQSNGTIADIFCDAHDQCECGEPATQTFDEGEEYALWTRQPRLTPVCAECFTRKDNAEPPEPDGEAFRGGEAAAYQAEQMHKARRLK
jgi:hypothetical protein